MDENKSGLYIVAIVGVIAVVALVVLVLAGTGGSKVVSVAGPASIDTADVAGQAVYLAGSTCSSNSDCKSPWCCVSVNGKNRCGSCSIGPVGVN